MRAVFGVLSSSVVLAIVGSLARNVSGLAVQRQSKALQDKVRDDTVRALQQGAARTKQLAEQN